MIVHISDLATRLGEEIGVSEWRVVTQERINQFAEATDDRQWIHVDPARAAVESPYQSTIAHGFLTLSLVSVLLKNAVTVEGVGMAINYGCDRVRFVSPVPSGSRIRGRFALTAAAPNAGGVQVTWGVTIEREGHERPCVVLSWLVRYYPSDG
ncbi:MAG: MaoC family dehydratase [Vicinamibacterales bacterium]